MAITLSLSLSESSVSVANNTSYVTATVYYTTTNSTYNGNKKPGTITISPTPGSSSSHSFSASFAKQQSGKYLASAGRTITHADNGTASVSARVSFTSGTNSGTVTASNSKTLTTIARASTMSCPSTFTAGTAGTITLSRKSSGFTHTASCTLGSTGLSATSGIATSFTYNPPTSLFNSSTYASSKSRTGTISVQTKNGSTSIGSALTQSITVNLPENSTTKPACSLGTSITESGTSYYDRYGVLISGRSKLRFTCSSSAKLSATIANHYFSIPGSTATRASDDTVTTGYLNTSSSEATFSYYVKDSRGFTSDKKTIVNPYKVVEYKNPNIINLTAIRCTENGVEDPVKGSKVKFKIDYYVDPIVLSDSDKTPNTATIKIYQLTLDDDGNATSRTLLKDSSGANLTVSSSGLYTELAATDFPTTNSFYYEATIVDELSTTEQSLGSGERSFIGTSKTLLSFYGGDGLAIGKIAEGSGLEVSLDSEFDNIAVFNEDVTFLKDVYVQDEELEMLCDSVTDNLIANNTTFKNDNRTSYASGITYTDEYQIASTWTKKWDGNIAYVHQAISGNTESYYSYVATPFVPIKKVSKGYVISVWFKVASVSGWDVKNPIQINYADSTGARLAHVSPGYNVSYSNSPDLYDNKWIKVIYTVPSSMVSTLMTNYATDKSFSDVAYLCVRLELAWNGDISFKLPVITAL